jgi:hypothetical protein
VTSPFFPNVVEAGRGVRFAEFFQTDRDGSPEGIDVLKIGGPT